MAKCKWQRKNSIPRRTDHSKQNSPCSCLEPVTPPVYYIPLLLTRQNPISAICPFLSYISNLPFLLSNTLQIQTHRFLLFKRTYKMTKDPSCDLISPATTSFLCPSWQQNSLYGFHLYLQAPRSLFLPSAQVRTGFGPTGPQKPLRWWSPMPSVWSNLSLHQFERWPDADPPSTLLLGLRTPHSESAPYFTDCCFLLPLLVSSRLANFFKSTVLFCHVYTHSREVSSHHGLFIYLFSRHGFKYCLHILFVCRWPDPSPLDACSLPPCGCLRDPPPPPQI